MRTKKICFIAQFPPPIHGLSKAIDTLYNSTLSTKYCFSKVNITNNKYLLRNIYKIIFSHPDLFYFTISQTKLGNWRDLLILQILKWKKDKCLIHLHGGYYRQLIDKDCGYIQRTINYSIIKNLCGCIVLSNSLHSIFEGMIDKNKIYTVSNGVDNQYLLPSNLLNEKQNDILKTKQLNILYLSNFIETKGFKDVLQLALLAKKNMENRLHFHFAGRFFREEDELYTRTFIDNNNLQDYITFHGIVSGEKKKQILKECHIFILPTRYPNEGQPISILEAMGNALAIITTNHAGIPDIVRNNINGLIINKNNINIQDIYQYILYLLKDRNTLKKIGTTNYQIITTQYTELQYISNMDKVFQSVLKL
ncbi:glycosyltransferase family 4 protein [Phocaeicola plebeius]|uniref:glycosyltransferase family 4 protein n=2 Tax=Phocaeicola plebeius TaxID=310297 RepID=UPI0026EBED22|nr:glycosyltransferase family 4 protein [Phocaeicola plebeius]